jgi:hypothetical protein
MATVSTAEPQVQLALHSCVTTLRRLADYELEPPLSHRLHDLSGRKASLSREERDELRALVDFAQQRTLERIEAQVALNRLRQVVPELLNAA